MATRERHTAEKANAESVVFDRANTVEIPASLWRHLRFEAKLALALRSRRTGGQRVNSARALVGLVVVGVSRKEAEDGEEDAAGGRLGFRGAALLLERFQF